MLQAILLLSSLLAALGAAWFLRPRPPAFEAERLFKTLLAALAWGRAEASGREEAWEDSLGRLLYHPAGRRGWEKVADPGSWEPPVPALPGERALLEKLARTPPTGRLRLLFDEGREALAADPRELGPDYDPERWLGAGCGWEALARWDRAPREALARRLQDRLLLLLAPPDEPWAEELARGAESLPARRHEPPADPLEGAEALGAELLADFQRPEERGILLAVGAAGPALLAALAAEPLLRDRAAAVVLLGCPLGPLGAGREPEPAWRGIFEQEALDTELRRSVPYLFVPRLEPGDGGLAWEEQRLDEPPLPPSGRRPVHVVELGPVHAGLSPEEQRELARALLLLLVALGA